MEIEYVKYIILYIMQCKYNLCLHMRVYIYPYYFENLTYTFFFNLS